MREREARRFVENFPEWIQEWGKKSVKNYKEEEGDGFDFDLQMLYKWAYHRAKGLVSAIQWFVHCLYVRGFKIVRK